jgi:alpha/beta hydrolase family protein
LRFRCVRADGIPRRSAHHRGYASGDPRKSLEQRYKDHAGHVKAVEKAVRKLQTDGFLLEEDVERFVDAAEASDVLK